MSDAPTNNEKSREIRMSVFTARLKRQQDKLTVLKFLPGDFHSIGDDDTTRNKSDSGLETKRKTPMKKISKTKNKATSLNFEMISMQPLENSRGGTVLPVEDDSTDLLAVYSVGFDIFDLSVPSLVDTSMEIMSQMNLFAATNKVNKEAVYGLVDSISRGYDATVSYHNFHHAFGAFHMAALLFNRVPMLQKVLKDNYTLAFLIACLGHDIEHPGYSNNLEILFQSKLALECKNEAVLESYHANRLYTLMSNHDVFADQVNLRMFVGKLVLMTDMATAKQHKDTAKRLSSAKSAQEFLNPRRSSHKQKMWDFFSMMIHACDISAQLLDVHVATRWEKRMAKEFYNEAEFLSSQDQQVPVFMQPYYSGNEADKASAQIGFINSHVLPLWKPLATSLYKSETTCRINALVLNCETAVLKHYEAISKGDPKEAERLMKWSKEGMTMMEKVLKSPYATLKR